MFGVLTPPRLHSPSRPHTLGTRQKADTATLSLWETVNRIRLRTLGHFVERRMIRLRAQAERGRGLQRVVGGRDPLPCDA